MVETRSIVITGASSGLGAALARELAASGITLWLTGRDRDRLESVSFQCEKKGAIAHIYVLDVLDRDKCARELLAIDDQSPIDLVFANAGIAHHEPGLEGLANQRVRQTTIDGVHNTIDPLLPRFLERGRGQIALMSSLAGWMPQPSAIVYSSSRAYIRFLGSGLRSAFHDTGVRVNVICPGFVDTPLTRRNTFNMPFMMSAEKAAKRIINGLQKDQAIIAFPWQLHFLTRLVALLPLQLQQALLRRLAPPDPNDQVS